MKPLFIGLTGGIATGKSTVARLIRKRGIPVIDCDRIAHRLIKRGSPIYKKLLSLFGRGILVKGGYISRKRVAAIVFKNKGLRRKLEALLHPVIWKEVLKEKRRLERGGAKVVLAEVPLLYEAGLIDEFDLIISVVCSRREQIKRCIEKLNLTKNEAMARISAQKDLKKKAKTADYVIDTSCSLREVKRKTKSLLNLILMSQGIFP